LSVTGFNSGSLIIALLKFTFKEIASAGIVDVTNEEPFFNLKV
jgi:hypothetical protein